MRDPSHPDPLPAVRRQSLVSATINALRSRIDDGTWPVGGRLPTEAELSEALGVGRNTVREAVRVLSHSEMLDVRQGDGTYVRSLVDPAGALQRINRSSVRDHLDLQSVVEAEAARFAARRRTAADVEKLSFLLDVRGERSDSPTVEDYLHKDRAFHVGVAAAAHNAAIEELYRFFAMSIPKLAQLLRQDGQPSTPDLAAHRVIVAAIERQDEEAAVAAARHVLEPRIRMLESLIAKAEREAF